MATRAIATAAINHGRAAPQAAAGYRDTFAGRRRKPRTQAQQSGAQAPSPPPPPDAVAAARRLRL